MSSYSYKIICRYEDKSEEVIEYNDLFSKFAEEKVKHYESFYANDNNYHYKIRYYRTNKYFGEEDYRNSFKDEVKCYTILQDSGLVPKYIESKILCKLSTKDLPPNANIIITMIKTEKYGKSLFDLYIPKDLHQKYDIEGCFFQTNNLKDYLKITFPEEYIPTSIIDKVIDILNILHEKYSIRCGNIHPYNFSEKDNKIYIINFPFVSFQH